MNRFDLDPIIILFNILEIRLHNFNILKILTYLLTIFLVLMFSWAFVTLFRTCKLKKSLSNHTGGSSFLSEEDHLHASSDPGVVWVRSFVDKAITRSGLACFAPCLSCLSCLVLAASDALGKALFRHSGKVTSPAELSVAEHFCPRISVSGTLCCHFNSNHLRRQLWWKRFSLFACLWYTVQVSLAYYSIAGRWVRWLWLGLPWSRVIRHFGKTRRKV